MIERMGESGNGRPDHRVWVTWFFPSPG